MSENPVRQLLAAALVAGVVSAPALAGSTKVASVEPANKTGTLDIAYSLAFWGIPFGDTNYDGKFGNNSYQVSSHFKTGGIVSIFWQSKIDAMANGHFDSHGLEPSLYDSITERPSQPQSRVKVTFGNGAPVTFADPAYDTKKYPVTDAEKKEALDPMSAATLILSGMTADNSNPCGKTAPVFDGRRRYNIEFTYIKDEPVKLDNGLFNGTAHLCQIHYNQIAGFKQKIIAEGKKLPPMYGLFTEVPSASAPNGHYVIALKLWADTGWGTVTVRLTSLNVNGPTASAAASPKG